MILFSRPAAEIILRRYSKIRMSMASISRFYSRLFQLDLNLRSQDASGQWGMQDMWLTLDWGYTPMLYMHGFASVGSIPNLARDLEFSPGHYLLNNYVRPECNNTSLVMNRSAATSAGHILAHHPA